MRNMSHIPERPTIAHNGVVVDVNDLLDYAKFYSRSHDAVIRVYDEAGNVLETHKQAGDFKE